ncbi:major capsid protein [Gordonia phage Nyceirae]|uniref:Major capsid protein n=1 Tax=Gordonia phage Nyceirae TaxID=1887651 RepID=A0A1C9EHV7_9CAUD|nr:major head protein [Gordonia phage Nyceirae]AON97374.1 major capsid protein [Gordonia phage Nyceirae]
MAVTLAQAAVLSTDQHSRGIHEIFVQESPVLDRLPLMEIAGNAYAYDLEATLPGVAFRGVNEAYVESTGTFNQLTERLVILGGDADVDRFIQQTRSDRYSQRAEQDKLKVKAISYKFNDHFFNGDTAVDTKGFDGLKKRLVGNQVIDAGTNGIPIVGNGGSDAYTFFDKLDELLAACPNADAMYANRQVRAKTLSAGRRLGGVEMVKEDITGKRVVMYQGVPMLDPGDNLAGGQILPQTETMGSASDTSSVYAVRFGGSDGDQAVTGLTNGGVMVDDLGQLQEKPALRTRIEFYCGVALFGGKAAARLRGVRNG